MSDLEKAARALLHQIDIGDFVDSNGHDAKMLKAVHDLRAALAAHEKAPQTENMWDTIGVPRNEP